MKEIACVVGTPIDLDARPTRNRAYGHYARILVDVDLSKRAFDEILLEREGYAFKVKIDELCQNEVFRLDNLQLALYT